MTKIQKKFNNQKGLGVIGVTVLVAVIIALVNAYAYYNPSFSLAKYSPLNYFRVKQDDIRVADLKKLESAIATYFEVNGHVPANDSWCGRISGIFHPEFSQDIKPYVTDQVVPTDPFRNNSNKDYFYYRVDRSHYVLMAVLEIPRDQGLEKNDYNFKACHDWPGDNIYNYRISNLDN